MGSEVVLGAKGSCRNARGMTDVSAASSKLELEGAYHGWSGQREYCATLIPRSCKAEAVAAKYENSRLWILQRQKCTYWLPGTYRNVSDVWALQIW